jgi:putative membrane protein
MQSLLAPVAVAALLVAAPAWAQTTSQSTTRPSATAASPSAPATERLSRSDQTFVKEAAKDGATEVELGKLGQQKAQNPRVKQLADKIVTDHEAANSQLMSIASSKGAPLDKDMEKDAQKARDKLAKVNGPEFDRQFADQLVKDHKKDISAFEKEAKNGKDPDVKSFAAQTLPTLQEHLQLAQAAANETKRTQTSHAPASRTSGTTGSTMSPNPPMSGTATPRQ